MFCHKCGAQSEEGSRYCPVCGENISPEDAPLLDAVASSVQTGETLVVQPPDVAEMTHFTEASLPAVTAPPRPPMKVMTRVAYNLLESDRKVVATFMVCLLILVSGYIAVSSCMGLVSAFAAVSDAEKALASGIENELISAGIGQAWRGVWINLAAIPLSLLTFVFSARLLVRISRVRRILNRVRSGFGK